MYQSPYIHVCDTHTNTLARARALSQTWQQCGGEARHAAIYTRVALPTSSSRSDAGSDSDSSLRGGSYLLRVRVPKHTLNKNTSSSSSSTTHPRSYSSGVARSRSCWRVLPGAVLCCLRWWAPIWHREPGVQRITVTGQHSRCAHTTRHVRHLRLPVYGRALTPAVIAAKALDNRRVRGRLTGTDEARVCSRQWGWRSVLLTCPLGRSIH